MRQIHTAAFTLYKTSLAEGMRSNRTPRYTTAVPHNKKQQTREKRHTSRARQYICCVTQPPCPAEGYRGKKRSARHVTKRRKQRIKTHFSKCLTLQKNDLFAPRLCRSRCSAQYKTSQPLTLRRKWRLPPCVSKGGKARNGRKNDRTYPENAYQTA